MCVSNDTKTKEKIIITNQIIEKDSEAIESSLITTRELQHDEVTKNQSEKSETQSPMVITSPSQNIELSNTSKDKLSPEPTFLVARKPETDHRLSPKKKRSRDQIEDVKDSEKQHFEKIEDKQEIHINSTRDSSSEPEKKRPRDTSELDKSPTSQKEIAHTSLQMSKDIELDEKVQDIKTADEKSDIVSGNAYPTEKNKLVFASSGFASMAASSVSPFGSLGLAKPSVFGGGFNIKSEPDTLNKSQNSALSNAGSNPNNSLDKETSTPFSLSGKSESRGKNIPGESVFSSAFSGSGFSSYTGPKLSSFAAPATGNQLLKSKVTRAFGAPEISSVEDDGKICNSDENKQSENNGHKESVVTGHEEKFKSKIKVDDGEAGEVTLLQIRAKLFAIESKTVGWKERGVGTLKINVPKLSVKYDGKGNPISGSYDKARLKQKDKSDQNSACAARLIMRQENTHRVVLNTFILREMKFEEKSAVSSAQFLFTALEGDKEIKPVRLLLKMSEINAKLFRAEIDSIKDKL